MKAEVTACKTKSITKTEGKRRKNLKAGVIACKTKKDNEEASCAGNTALVTAR